MQTVSSLKDVLTFLESRLPKTRGNKYRGNWGLRTVKKFLTFLGRPQEKYQVIHIAGTSGKGSTAKILSEILGSQNLKVGLHLSPFIIDFRELFQINNALLEEPVLAPIVTDFITRLEAFEEKYDESLSYFELLVCLALFIFEKQEVEYAVLEVGLGGLYDATNAVTSSSKICLLSSIGYDHQEVLGDTLTEIATQKAGIIHKNNMVIAIDQEYPEAEEVFVKEAESKEAELTFVRPENGPINFKCVDSSLDGNIFNFKAESLELNNLKLGLLGDYQIRNAALALAGFSTLIKQKQLKVSEEKLVTRLQQIDIAGRFQVFPKNSLSLDDQKNKSEVIIDGAHNTQKISNLVSNLQKYYPGEKFIILLAMTEGKNFLEVLDNLSEVASRFVLTKFQFLVLQNNYKKSLDPSLLAKNLEANGKPTTILNLEEALSQLFILPNQKILITGSLYLVGQVLGRLKKSSLVVL